MAELRRAKAQKEAQFHHLSDSENGSDDEMLENVEDLQLKSKWSDDSE